MEIQGNGCRHLRVEEILGYDIVSCSNLSLLDKYNLQALLILLTLPRTKQTA